MHIHSIITAIMVCTMCHVSATAENAGKADFYVAPGGSDRGPGTLESPFATLERARDAVRTRKATEDRDLLVLISGGTYRLTRTVVFGVQDSAREGRRIVYAAYPGETPVIDGSIPIRGWAKAETPLPGLPQNAHDRIWVADVSEEAGIFRSLYDGDRRLPRARTKGRQPRLKFGQQGVSRFKLPFPPGMLKSWPNLPDVDIRIIPTYPWVCNLLPLASVDEKMLTALTAVPATYYLAQTSSGHFPDGTLWVENVLEGLDRPGEWVFNSQTRKLYLFPPDGKAPGASITAPRLTELIRVEGDIRYDKPGDTPVKGLEFRGLTFTRGDRWPWESDRIGWGLQHDWEMFDRPTALVRFRGAEDCAVTNCRFVNSGGAGMRLDLHCQRNRIAGNEFAHIGGTGVLLAGYGPGTKDVNRQNNVTDNNIHHVGEILWHAPGIFVWQSGENRVAHNLVHHTPYIAIVVSGRIGWRRDGWGEASKTIRWTEIDAVIGRGKGVPSWKVREPFLHSRRNVVECNDIHHTMQMLGDGNCIYISGAGGGNVIRRNYLHDVDGPNINAAIRCDDDQHETSIESNVIFRCCGEGFISKGNNAIINNIVADLRPRSADGTKCAHQRGFIVLPYGQVKGSRIERNLFVSRVAGQRICSEGGDEKRGIARLRDCRADYNLYFNYADPHWGESYLKEQRQFGVETHSVVADPLFVNLRKGDFRLKPESPALSLGFNPIDISDVGPRKKQVSK